MASFDDYISVHLSDEILLQVSSVTVGSQSFQVIVEELKTLREVLVEANKVEKFVADDVRDTVNQILSELSTNLTEIISFDASKVSNAGERYSTLVTLVRQRSQACIKNLLPPISMRGVENLAEIREIERESGKILQKLQKTEQVVSSQQGAAATDHASAFFKSKAVECRNKAKKYAIWLIMVSVSAILFSLFWPHDWTFGKEKTTVSLVNALPTINTLAVAWFAIRLLAKNLRNYQHLAIVNETKAMILLSGEQFSLSAQGAPVSDNILQIVVASTFTVGDTGYLPSDPEAQGLPNSSVMSLWNNVTGKV